MNFNQPITIEEVVVARLSGNAASGAQLLEEVRIVKKTLTKQALYVVLRRLLAQEVVVKHGTMFSLSSVWLGKMASFFERAQERYGTHRETTDFLALGGGDKISYSFKSPKDADRFWGHAFDVLVETTSPFEPVYVYNPHEWFLLAREESEVYLFDKLKNTNRKLWLLAGGDTALDKYVRKYFDGAILQYHTLTQPLFENRAYYINLFGDFIIEAILDHETVGAIELWYQSVSDFSETSQTLLKDIVSRGKTRLTISHNPRKAAKLKRLFKEYFL